MVDKERLETFLAERPNVIIAGTRSDGRPHVTPNWFLWDGERFYVSTTRSRAKYSIFRHEPRAQLLFDDAVDFRAVLVEATAEIREDIAAELSHFRQIREKYGVNVPADDEHEKSLSAEGRVLLVLTPNGPPDTWMSWGLD